jgi:hypothetical protein
MVGLSFLTVNSEWRKNVSLVIRVSSDVFDDSKERGAE